MKISHLVALSALAVFGCNGQQHAQHATPQIVFALKAFFDEPELVYVAGTLTGPDIGYANNSTAITCYKDRRECIVYTVQQIGENQVGRLETPGIYPVTKWDEEEIVATGVGDAVDCSRVTISIVRKAKTALWVQSRSIRLKRSVRTPTPNC